MIKGHSTERRIFYPESFNSFQRVDALYKELRDEPLKFKVVKSCGISKVLQDSFKSYLDCLYRYSCLQYAVKLSFILL